MSRGLSLGMLALEEELVKLRECVGEDDVGSVVSEEISAEVPVVTLEEKVRELERGLKVTRVLIGFVLVWVGVDILLGWFM